MTLGLFDGSISTFVASFLREELHSKLVEVLFRSAKRDRQHPTSKAEGREME